MYFREFRECRDAMSRLVTRSPECVVRPKPIQRIFSSINYVLSMLFDIVIGMASSQVSGDSQAVDLSVTVLAESDDCDPLGHGVDLPKIGLSIDIGKAARGHYLVDFFALLDQLLNKFDKLHSTSAYIDVTVGFQNESKSE